MSAQGHYLTLRRPAIQAVREVPIVMAGSHMIDQVTEAAEVYLPNNFALITMLCVATALECLLEDLMQEACDKSLAACRAKAPVLMRAAAALLVMHGAAQMPLSQQMGYHTLPISAYHAQQKAHNTSKFSVGDKNYSIDNTDHMRFDRVI
jgi:hypothetical protein